MSNEYTPTDEDARNVYIANCNVLNCPLNHAAEFDRWLAEHDREQLAAKDAEIARMAEEIERLQRESDM